MSMMTSHRSVPAGSRWLATAPGRVCLGGEDLDWLGGPSLHAAIARRLTLGVEVGQHDQATASAMGYPVAPHGLLAYVAEARSLLSGVTNTLPSLTLDTKSEICPGAGLSSSAALAVALAAICLTVIRGEADRGDIIDLAFGIESLGDRRGGPMDYVPCTMGGISLVSARSAEDFDIEMIESPSDLEFVVADSGQRRSTRDVLVAKRARASRREGGILRYKARATEVTTEAVRVVKDFANADRALLGACLDELHRTMREDLDASTPALEQLHIAFHDEGALGAKITGTGMGGCIVGVVPLGQADAIRDRLRERGYDSWVAHVEPDGVTTIREPGAEGA